MVNSVESVTRLPLEGCNWQVTASAIQSSAHNHTKTRMQRKMKNQYILHRHVEASDTANLASLMEDRIVAGRPSKRVIYPVFHFIFIRGMFLTKVG
jgi:hypothetical protein